MQNNNFLWSSDSLKNALQDCLLSNVAENIFANEIFLDSRKSLITVFFWQLMVKTSMAMILCHLL